jgi:hypothetical protein
VLLSFSLTLPSGPHRVGQSESVEFDDFQSLIVVTCGYLAETDCIFRAAGFGDNDWPVDVSYDLSALMEQLPDALNALRADRACEIDFYGQGIERTLYFAVDGPWVNVECRSGTTWTPTPAVVRHHKKVLVELLEGMAKGFADAVAIGVPELADVDIFVRWRQGRV